MKICMARLRSGVNYTIPNQHIMDSFYHLLRDYIGDHSEHEWLYYNFGFGNKPVRDLEAVRQADLVIIPTENEFHYHIPGYIHTLDWKRPQEYIRQVEENLHGKQVAIMTNDRADTPKLFAEKVFPNLRINPNEIKVLDEMDFPGGIHQMKYYFINNAPQDMFSSIQERLFSFVYWGSTKNKLPGDNGKAINSGDERGIILKQIKRNTEIPSYFIGRYIGFDADMKMQKGMAGILPFLKQGLSTLCFNWLDSKATTARYHEAIACGMIPFVWKHYDAMSSLVAYEWQRVFDIEEIFQKLKDISRPETFLEHLDVIQKSYKSRLLSWNDLYKIFSRRMDEICQ